MRFVHRSREVLQRDPNSKDLKYERLYGGSTVDSNVILEGLGIEMIAGAIKTAVIEITRAKELQAELALTRDILIAAQTDAEQVDGYLEYVFPFEARTLASDVITYRQRDLGFARAFGPNPPTEEEDVEAAEEVRLARSEIGIKHIHDAVFGAYAEQLEDADVVAHVLGGFEAWGGAVLPPDLEVSA